MGGTSLSRTNALKLIGNKDPCGGKVCSSCRTDSSFPLTTKKWGSLTLRGFKGFIAVLDQAFNDMAKESAQNNNLLGRIGSRGLICCRLVRRASGGCGSSWSMHSFGMAVDLKVDGYNDAHGDNCIHKPLFDIHKYFNKYGIYWGKDFSTEDAMHYEVSNELAAKWIANGVPEVGGGVVAVPAPPTKCEIKHGSKAVCKNTAECTGQREALLCPGPANIQCCYGEATVPPLVEACVKTFGTDAKCVAESACTNVVRKESAYCSKSGEVCCAPDLCKKALGTTAKCIDDTDKCDGSVSNDLCPGGVRCCAPATDYPPVGQLAAASGAVSGWACDKNSPDSPIDVHIYLNEPAGSGVGTSLRRTCPHCLGKTASGVDKTKCGCAGDCKVGFELDWAYIEGAKEAAGKQINVYAYAINEGSGGPNIPLTGSPVTVTVPSTPSPTPAGSPTPVYEPQALPACFSPTACDSSLECCEFCSPLPAGSLCRAGGEGGCKEDAFCDGVQAFCPSRVRKAEKSPCDDGNECTGPDMCTLDGTCFGEPKKGNGCVGCVNNSECDDGNACSVDECVDGVCKYRTNSQGAGKLCRRSKDSSGCDYEEFCTGTSLLCPEDESGCLDQDQQEEVEGPAGNTPSGPATPTPTNPDGSPNTTPVDGDPSMAVRRHAAIVSFALMLCVVWF